MASSKIGSCGYPRSQYTIQVTVLLADNYYFICTASQSAECSLGGRQSSEFGGIHYDSGSIHLPFIWFYAILCNCKSFGIPSTHLAQILPTNESIFHLCYMHQGVYTAPFGGHPFIVGTTNIATLRQMSTVPRSTALSTHTQDGWWIGDTFASTQVLLWIGSIPTQNCFYSTQQLAFQSILSSLFSHCRSSRKQIHITQDKKNHIVIHTS